MTTVAWRIVEWHLRRQMVVDQLIPVLGDLSEDLQKERRLRGAVGASLWLLREGRSVAKAYRTQHRHDRRFSRRTIMGGSWREDGRLAWRRLRKHPAATVAAVLTLACAIAAGAVTWSVISSVLIHPLPVAAPEELVVLNEQFPAMRGFPARISGGFLYRAYHAIRDANAFEAIAGNGGGYPVLVGDSDSAVPLQRPVEFVSHDYFATLGVRLAKGRPFTATEDQRGAPVVAIVSDRYWRNVLDADPDVIGRTITLARQRATIVGVAPRGFRGLQIAASSDLFVPLHSVGDLLPLMSNPFNDPTVKGSPTSWIRIVARMKHGEGASQARARLQNALSSPKQTGTFQLVPVNEAALPAGIADGTRQFARLLATTVGLLLAIGCLTVGLLLLLRTETRREEFAMCLALGATRASLSRGIIIEGALLSLGGAALSVPAAAWLFDAMRTFALPGQIEFDILDLSVDRTTLTAVAIGAALAAFLISLAAGVFGFSPNIADVLRSKAGGTPRVRRRRARAVLVSAQVAVALVLMSGAVLFSRSLSAALTINPGFDARRVVTTNVALRQYGYEGPRAMQFLEDVRARLEATPGTESATVSYSSGSMGTEGKIVIDGTPRQFPSEVYERVVDHRYFSTMGMRVIEGRDFSTRDTPSSGLVIIVSQSFAKAIAGGGEIIGRKIAESHWRIGEEPATATVIGVVPDVIVNVNDTQPLVRYYPVAQSDASGLFSANVAMRTAADAPGAQSTLLSAVRSIDSAITPSPPLTIEDRLRSQMSAQDLGQFVLGGLGGIAALLTVLGAYVLAESMSTMRRRELTIRGALGASRVRLGRLVIIDTIWLVGAGLIAGLILAATAASSIERFLFRIEPLDLATLLSVSGAILATTVLVSLRPAIDAGRVDLNYLLRHE